MWNVECGMWNVECGMWKNVGLEEVGRVWKSLRLEEFKIGKV